MRGLQQLLTLRSLLCGAGALSLSLSESAAFPQALPSLAQALQQLGGVQARGVKKQANEVSHQLSGGGSSAAAPPPPGTGSRGNFQSLATPACPQPRQTHLLCVYKCVQLRIGNVIEHNGKLLQVVSMQNRAMGVSPWREGWRGRVAGRASESTRGWVWVTAPVLARLLLQTRWSGASNALCVWSGEASLPLLVSHPTQVRTRFARPAHAAGAVENAPPLCANCSTIAFHRTHAAPAGQRQL